LNTLLRSSDFDEWLSHLADLKATAIMKRKKVTYKPFDAAAYLDNDAVIAEYLPAAAEDPNPEVFVAALGNVAKARGMAQIAKDACLGRESPVQDPERRRPATPRNHQFRPARPRREVRRCRRTRELDRFLGVGSPNAHVSKSARRRAPPVISLPALHEDRHYIRGDVGHPPEDNVHFEGPWGR
jgi:hypothetical protein